MLESEYTENLFQSIDTIIAERIKRLPYDQTSIVEIVDASQAEFGIYKVSPNNTFIETVYSDNPTYQLGDKVYVMSIPGNRRFIIGLYLRNDGVSRINRIFETNTVKNPAKLIELKQEMDTSAQITEQVLLNSQNIEMHEYYEQLQEQLRRTNKCIEQAQENYEPIIFTLTHNITNLENIINNTNNNNDLIKKELWEYQLQLIKYQSSLTNIITEKNMEKTRLQSAIIAFEEELNNE